MGLELKDLPTSTFVGIVTLDEYLISKLLDKANVDEVVAFSAAVHGAPVSIRLLAPEQFKGSTPYDEPMDHDRAAREIVRLMAKEARYDPFDKKGSEKGVEVRKIRIDGEPAVLIQAVCVS